MPAVAAGVLWLSGVAGQAQNRAFAGGEKPPILLPGLGNHTHPISTRNAEAQKFFDQGLMLLYGFNRYEAFRSFRRAAELDPAAVMPHWGMAMAWGPHVNMDLDGDVDMGKSCEAVRAAQALVENASERERAYVRAVSARCPEYQPEAYQKAMRDLANRYPDDLDAATLYAESLMIPVRWKWWTPDGSPAEGMPEAISILESVMRRDLDHPGANHFYIHAVEMSPSPERAIASAQRLMALAPSAGHLLHMPSHIWLLLGGYDLAAEVNLRAAAADEEYMQTTGVTRSAYCAGYYVHNLHFVAYNRSMEGRMADSVAAATRIAGAVSPFFSQMPMMIDAFVPWPLFARLRFGRWDQILELQPPDPKLLASTAVWHYGRGVALAAKERREEALRERDAFESARRQVPDDWPWLNNKAKGILDVASAILDARLAESDSAALAHWEQAVKAQDALSYDEPPPWFYPVRESLGGALLRLGRAAEAEAVFREGLRRAPRDGRMLFGLIQSLNVQGKTEAAGMVQQEFQEAWKKADVMLRVEDL
jgi:tetratricopeptide (TPR) repeat protein